MKKASEKQQKFIKKMLGIKAKKSFRTIREIMDEYRIEYLDLISKEQANKIITKLLLEGYGPDNDWGRNL